MEIVLASSMGQSAGTTGARSMRITTSPETEEGSVDVANASADASTVELGIDCSDLDAYIAKLTIDGLAGLAELVGPELASGPG